MSLLHAYMASACLKRHWDAQHTWPHLGQRVCGGNGARRCEVVRCKVINCAGVSNGQTDVGGGVAAEQRMNCDESESIDGRPRERLAVSALGMVGIGGQPHVLWPCGAVAAP